MLGQNCRSSHGSKHQTRLLGREFCPCPPWPRVPGGHRAGAARAGTLRSGPAAPSPRSWRPLGRQRLETEMFSSFSKAACPAAGIPAQTLSQSLSSFCSAKLLSCLMFSPSLDPRALTPRAERAFLPRFPESLGNEW